MKILHIAAKDITGGASRSSYRLHQGLLLNCIDSTIIVDSKESEDENVVVYKSSGSMCDRLQQYYRKAGISIDLLKYHRTRPSGLELFSDVRSQYGDSFKDIVANYDLVNLHWASGFLDYEAFFSHLPVNKPVIWTLHDMNPFTGGCHYSGKCKRFRNKCGACPQLGSDNENDLSRSNWIKKNDAIVQSKLELLHIVTPSQWLARQAKESSLFGHLPISIIPYGIDTGIFYPRDTEGYRGALGIPCDAVVIGFVADTTKNKRKGLHFLKEAIEIINDNNIYLVSVGKNAPVIPDCVNHIHLGSIESDSLLSRIYSLFDVYVCASVEDNLPNTVIESLACGTPVAGFHIGGMPDMVIDGKTGFLAPDINSESLATCIKKLLTDKNNLKAMASWCREKAITDYGLLLQAKNYSDLYASILYKMKI